SSLDTCPVCGVGSDKFVPVEDTGTDFRKDTEETFVILGGGPGAHYAAEAIRERIATAKIQIITAESHLPYNRPMLTKVLLQNLAGDRLAIENRAWYDERNIEILFETNIESVDIETKKVSTDKGEFAYDKLIYALVARCFVLPIPGADKPHVVSIRSIADCRKAQEIVAMGAKKAVVIGGGVMGLESGWELKKGGLDVTVLETAPGLLPRQLDDAASAMLQAACEKAGVHVVTGAKIAEIADDAVVLADGTRYEAGLVIMSTGMRGNIAIGQAAGLETNILIKIDRHCATSAPDVWACGDCTEFNGAPHGFWSQAAETGRAAGANAAGEEIAFRPYGSAMSINAMDTSIFALGTNGKAGPDTMEPNLRTVEIRDEQRGNYEKYYFRKSRLAGVILIGDTSKMTDMTRAL
ncbi:MAG: NAD(P)/FAD-dependent oxidoreductase, partial [Oscillospiraceae bacterium]|nr:NAD(P)/FAD-dependent oxidoreductase [Oscillospiraceae bacterium]